MKGYWLADMYPSLKKNELSVISRKLKNSGTLVYKRWDDKTKKTRAWVEGEKPKIGISGEVLESVLAKMFEELYTLRRNEELRKKEEKEKEKTIQELKEANKTLKEENIMLRRYGQETITITPAIRKLLSEYNT